MCKKSESQGKEPTIHDCDDEHKSLEKLKIDRRNFP